MHSLSFAFAMTAFARAAAGFYILNSSHPEVARFGYVKVEFAPDNAWAGFTDLISSRYAQLRVDASGDIGTSFVLRSVGNETWGMLSRQGTSVQVGDITGPFVVDENDHFVYAGPGGPYFWNVCIPRSRTMRLYLSTRALPPNDCIGASVPLTAVYVTDVESTPQ